MIKDKNPKVILLGDINVGKTAIIQTLVNQQFPNRLASTMGACFQRYSCRNQQGKQVSMDIWDTAGQEKYRSLLTLYYKNSDVIIVVFDLSCRQSFQTVQQWASLIQTNCDTKPEVILVGNKYDLRKQVKLIANTQIQQYTKRKKWHYFNASALQNYNIKQIFKKAATLAYSSQSKIQKKQSKPAIRIQANQPNQKKDGCCS